jgi:hypothetical protein
LADKLRTAIRKDLTDQKAYYDYLKTDKEEFYDPREAEINEFMLQLLEMVEKNYAQTTAPVQENPRRAADTTVAQ